MNFYETRKSLAVIHREQLNQFINVSSKIIDFLSKFLEQTAKRDALITMLKTHLSIDSFARISKVNVSNYAKYEKDILDSNKN